MVQICITARKCTLNWDDASVCQYVGGLLNVMQICTRLMQICITCCFRRSNEGSVLGDSFRFSKLY